MVEVIEKKAKSGTKPTVIPDTLIYEYWNKIPVYYQGYMDVLAGLKQPEEVMSCSDIQGAIIALLVGYLHATIDRKKYTIRTNEVGLNLSKGNNLGIDIAISLREGTQKLTRNYLKISPKIVIEVDVKADTTTQHAGDTDYILKKSKKLLNSGTEKVIWILTASQKIIIISNDGSNSYMLDWDENVYFLDWSFNLSYLLKEDNIIF